MTCHECGRRLAALGWHVCGHDMTADEYRESHGLSRGQPLTSLGTAAALSAASSARVGTAGWQRMVAHRDPQAAAAARDFTVTAPAVRAGRGERAVDGRLPARVSVPGATEAGVSPLRRRVHRATQNVRPGRVCAAVRGRRSPSADRPTVAGDRPRYGGRAAPRHRRRTDSDGGRVAGGGVFVDIAGQVAGVDDHPLPAPVDTRQHPRPVGVLGCALVGQSTPVSVLPTRPPVSVDHLSVTEV